MSLLALSNGKLRNAGDVELADKIIEYRKNKGQWETIALLVDAWGKNEKDDFQAFKVQLDDYRLGLSDRKFGQTKDGKDHDRRMTMVFPQKLFLMIRSVYKANELPMGRKFYDEFLKRFPFFRIPDKL